MTRTQRRRPVTVLPGAGETGGASAAAPTAGPRGARPPYRSHRGSKAAAGRAALRARGATLGGAPA